MGVSSLLKTVTRQRRDCDLNLGPSAPESSTLTTRLPSHPHAIFPINIICTPLQIVQPRCKVLYTTLQVLIHAHN